jgi:large subunit ribosomal protein L23
MKVNIVKQLNTEKTYKLGESFVYVFLVSKNSRKDEIKKNIESSFGVKVVNVNTLNTPKKIRSFRGVQGIATTYKKAYITLEKGQKIEFGSEVKQG